MNILIIGAGAVGIGLAASVKSQGANVSLFAKGKTARAISEKGIKRCGLFAHYSFDSSEIDVYEEYENTKLKRYLHPHVHYSIIYNSQDMGTT